MDADARSACDAKFPDQLWSKQVPMHVNKLYGL